MLERHAFLAHSARMRRLGFHAALAWAAIVWCPCQAGDSESGAFALVHAVARGARLGVGRRYAGWRAGPPDF